VSRWSKRRVEADIKDLDTLRVQHTNLLPTVTILGSEAFGALMVVVAWHPGLLKILRRIMGK
jgi:hypothetical protein